MKTIELYQADSKSLLKVHRVYNTIEWTKEDNEYGDTEFTMHYVQAPTAHGTQDIVVIQKKWHIPYGQGYVHAGESSYSFVLFASCEKHELRWEL